MSRRLSWSDPSLKRSASDAAYFAKCRVAAALAFNLGQSADVRIRSQVSLPWIFEMCLFLPYHSFTSAYA